MTIILVEQNLDMIRAHGGSACYVMDKGRIVAKPESISA